MSESEIDDAELARIWASAVRAIAAVQQSAADEIEALGIPFAYFSVLRLVLDSEERRLPMSRIARDLSMTSGGFTKLADRMARDGYIDRRGSSGDRRVVFAALTEKGLEVGRRAETAYLAVLRHRVLDVVAPAQLRLIGTLADRVYDATGGSESEPGPWQVEPRPDDAPDRRSRSRDDDAGPAGAGGDAADTGDDEADDRNDETGDATG
jgi:DNA-binding MarR family transcriptional regulator